MENPVHKYKLTLSDTKIKVGKYYIRTGCYFSVLKVKNELSMVKIYTLAIILLSLIGCTQNSKETESTDHKIVFSKELATELKRMAEMDQIAAYIPQGKYKKYSSIEWNEFKDSVYKTHEKRLQEIFEENGFIGFDLAGEEGSNNFWLMTQHSDHNPRFQDEVLKKMKIEVENMNADPGNYGLLVDRVKLNYGLGQVYGTQVEFNKNTGQAFSKKIMDSVNVNKRRKSIGLEPLEVYLNSMSEIHFEINKETFIKIGITEPNLYKIE